MRETRLTMDVNNDEHAHHITVEKYNDTNYRIYQYFWQGDRYECSSMGNRNGYRQLYVAERVACWDISKIRERNDYVSP